MGALPRPALASGPHRELIDALHSLHHRAGWPSLRHLATQTGVSHTTVSKALSSPALPSWGVVELLVEALGGDVLSAHELWLAASSPDPTTRPEVRIAGRRDELAAVRRHAEGSGLLLVTGEAGIGKSTLVEAALGAVDTQAVIGHCLPLSREMPLMPVVDALRSIHQLHGGEWMEQALARCPDYVRGSMASLLPELDPRAAAPPEDSWGLERLFASLVATLRALSAVRPLVLVLEDCHWADRGTLDLLTRVASVPSEPPVVITWRTGDPDVTGSHPEWLSRTRWLAAVTPVELRPLGLQETAEQLQLLRGTATDHELAVRIHARTRGLPLYTAQLAANVDDVGLPRHLADLLDRRIGDLDDESWRVARVLGLAQRRVGPEVLRGATGLSSDAVADALRALAGRRLLRSEGGDDAELAHPLLVDAIERRLVPGEGTEVHARIAEVLSSSPGIQAGEIADHWRAAGRPDREASHRVAAARWAYDHFAHQEAWVGWLRVLELWDAGHRGEDVQLWDVLVRALDAAMEIGELVAGRQLATRADSLELPERERAQVLERIGSLLYDTGEVARAEELLAEALRLLERLPDPGVLLVRVLEQHYWMFVQSGRFAEAETVLTRSLSLFEAQEDSGLKRRALAGKVWLTMRRSGDVEASLAVATEATAAALPQPDPVADLMIAASATDILLHVPSSAGRAEVFARRALLEAERFGVETVFPAVVVRVNLSMSHLWAGDTRAAREWIQPITRATPGTNTAIAHVILGAVELREGDPAAALERCRAAAGQMPNHDDYWAEVTPWIAEVELWARRPTTAMERLSEAVEIRLTSDAVSQAGPVLLALVRAHADLLEAARADRSRRHEAGRELRQLLLRARTDLFPADTSDCAAPALAASWQAELSRVEATEKVETWVRAAAAWDGIARPHEAAYCRWRAGQVALTQEQRTLALRLLRRAATDAHQHVLLREAIAATARGA